LIVVRFVAPPTEANLQAADPFLRLLPAWLVAPMAIAIAAAWLKRARPSREELGRAARRGLAGAAVGLAAVAALRAIAGPRLPSFIPAEESAAPGLWLSMAAGFGEELELRLLLLPIVYRLLSRSRFATPLAIVITGAAFALLHGAAPLRFVATRFLLPGCAFSAAALALGPSFVVIAHCTAHLVLPLLFSG
jgi:membrane protease YdiL (CAAX protease family)